jgi:small-conductance mechanosensitive channel
MYATTGKTLTRSGEYMQLVLAVLLTICFLIMGVNTQKLLVAFSSILLPSVFVFGNAARSTFESLIFLFIMHPFDVGDRILVDGNSLVVEVCFTLP